MDWQSVAAIAAVLSSVVFGTLTIVRGDKSDKALNMATTVQSVYVAQQGLITSMSAEIGRVRGLLEACEVRDRNRAQQVERLERRIDELEGTHG